MHTKNSLISSLCFSFIRLLFHLRLKFLEIELPKRGHPENLMWKTMFAGRSPVELEQHRASPGEFARRLEPPGDFENLPLRLEISRRSPGGGNAAVIQLFEFYFSRASRLEHS
jgi:hypothetical protein